MRSLIAQPGPLQDCCTHNAQDVPGNLISTFEGKVTQSLCTKNLSLTKLANLLKYDHLIVMKQAFESHNLLAFLKMAQTHTALK